MKLLTAFRRQTITRILKLNKFESYRCIAVIGIVPFTLLFGVLKTKGIHFQRSLAIEILWYFLITLFYSTFICHKSFGIFPAFAKLT